MTQIGTFEVKTNYKDDGYIIIEEFTNIDKTLGNISVGWFYKSKTDFYAFVSKTTRHILIIPNTDKFKSHYELIKDDFELIPNKISIRYNCKWQSAYRRIPLKYINGYYSYHCIKDWSKSGAL